MTSIKELDSIHLVGIGTAGISVLFARALADGISRCVVDVVRLNTAQEKTWQGDLYIPGIKRCGDVTTAGRLVAPAPLMLISSGTRHPPPIARALAAGV